MSTLKPLQNEDNNNKTLFNDEDDAVLIQAMEMYELQQKCEENVTEHKNMDQKNQPKINNNHSLPFENNHHFYEEINVSNTVHKLYPSEELEKCYEENLYEDMNQFDIRNFRTPDKNCKEDFILNFTDRTKKTDQIDEEYIYGIKTAQPNIQKHQPVNTKLSIKCIPAKRRSSNESLEIEKPRLFGKCSESGEEDKKIWNYAENSTITGKVWNYPDNPRIAEKVWNCPEIPRSNEKVWNCPEIPKINGTVQNCSEIANVDEMAWNYSKIPEETKGKFNKIYKSKSPKLSH